MLTLLLATTTWATNLIVPVQQPTVGDAVAALVGPGPHTIYIVVDSHYVEPSVVVLGGMDLTVIGTGLDTTILSVADPGAASVFSVTGGRLRLEDLALTGDQDRFTPECDWPTSQRGIDGNSAVVELSGVHVGCFQSTGGGAGVLTIASDLSIEASVFEDNVSLNSGAHVFAGGSVVAPPTVTVTASQFDRGDSGVDGGALFLGTTVARVEDNDFVDNTAVGHGGALAAASAGAGGSLELWQNRFDTNQSLAGDGGAVHVGMDVVDVWANRFCANAADRGAGLAVVDAADVELMNNIWYRNDATSYGGGLFLQQTVVPTDEPSLLNNTFVENRASLGGAVMVDGTVSTQRNNLVSGQLAGGGQAALHGVNFFPGDPQIHRFNALDTNCELDGCDPAGPFVHFGGDLAGLVVDPTILLDQAPMLALVPGGFIDCDAPSLHPVWGSPLVGAGEDLYPEFVDIDGTRNDIGHTGGSRSTSLDRDLDGVLDTLDCNDLDPTISPLQFEACDLVDNDCDGEVDEGWPYEFYEDLDGDGYGGDFWPFVGCTEQGPGLVSSGGDCDETNIQVNPGADEICDTLDNDCSGVVDDADPVLLGAWYDDDDGDGYGDAATRIDACFGPDVQWVLDGTDCDDSDAAAFPGGTEICDLVDNDCNGSVDDEPADGQAWYTDADGDGFGAGEPLLACAPPTADMITTAGDCNDADAASSPSSPEVCDGVDNDCNGTADDGAVDALVGYADLDGDGALDAESATEACALADHLQEAGNKPVWDCDDTDPDEVACADDKGCGCSAAGPAAPSVFGLWLAVLLAVRRRR